MTTSQQPLDARGTIDADPAAMEVRNAMLAWLRAWEQMHNLPRSIPTLRERGRKDGALPKDKT
jgi:hypothetical protein